MNRRSAHHYLKHFTRIKSRYFLALALVSLVVCIAALRANNEHMVQLRSAVYAADKDNTDVQRALQQLQAYVTAHMNTTLNNGSSTVYPPIQLKYTYDRLVQAQSTATAQKNTQLYSEAQAHCEALNHTDFSGKNRVPCITDYVQSHTSTPLANVPDALYKFDFVSPGWSPDLAGWSLVATIISALLFIASFALRKLPHLKNLG